MEPNQLPEHVREWVAADRRQDLTLMQAQLSDDVVLISPLTDAFTFTGPDEVMAVFEAAFELLADIEIANVTGAGTDWVIHGTNTIGGDNLEEIQWLQLGTDGRIALITLFIRPAPAAITLLSRIGPGLRARGLMGAAAATASGAAKPLAAALRLTEGRVMPRLRKDPPVDRLINGQ